jgi:hypothetical protein
MINPYLAIVACMHCQLNRSCRQPSTLCSIEKHYKLLAISSYYCCHEKHQLNMILISTYVTTDLCIGLVVVVVVSSLTTYKCDMRDDAYSNSRSLISRISDVHE